MKLDVVHDLQAVYRKLVDATSRPGSVIDLQREVEVLDVQTNCLSTTLLIALTVLDPEVTFKVITKQEEAVSRLINQLTYSKSVDASDADFIFILEDALHEEMGDAMNQAKVGNLSNPHESAMIILEVSDVTKGKPVKLSGPGIQGETYLNMQNVSNWMEMRNEKNIEFPLGIDMYFVDHQHQLLAIPRTTQIKENGWEIKWDM
ncbi:phosphonate C-P lyase system protein PhnH [Bacillus cihuensis]|uniref:phosphonate C-P lyase system protein PhnH n=1 Tax=Bacillus cihuensis TaxID=1208599 RepID=UPI000412F463|nr:phosphonate C-P lyase system protein PhnH [Bacillus cihuensis]